MMNRYLPADRDWRQREGVTAYLTTSCCSQPCVPSCCPQPCPPPCPPGPIIPGPIGPTGPQGYPGPDGATGTILIGKCVKSNKILKNYNKIYHITWSAALWRLWAAFSYITTEEGGM